MVYLQTSQYSQVLDRDYSARCYLFYFKGMGGKGGRLVFDWKLWGFYVIYYREMLFLPIEVLIYLKRLVCCMQS